MTRTSLPLNTMSLARYLSRFLRTSFKSLTSCRSYLNSGEGLWFSLALVPNCDFVPFYLFSLLSFREGCFFIGVVFSLYQVNSNFFQKSNLSPLNSSYWIWGGTVSLWAGCWWRMSPLARGYSCVCGYGGN